jgi:hypothetical protein
MDLEARRKAQIREELRLALALVGHRLRDRGREPLPPHEQSARTVLPLPPSERRAAHGAIEGGRGLVVIEHAYGLASTALHDAGTRAAPPFRPSPAQEAREMLERSSR